MNQCSTPYRGRFAILRHQITSDGLQGDELAAVGRSLQDHFDLLIETDSNRLLAWRLYQQPPLFQASFSDPVKVSAERILDHRDLYLDYEGKISGNRGTVKRLFGGIYCSTGQQHGVANPADKGLCDLLDDSEEIRRDALLHRLSTPEKSVGTHCTELGEDVSKPIGLSLFNNAATFPLPTYLVFRFKCEDRLFTIVMQITAIGQTAELLFLKE